MGEYLGDHFRGGDVACRYGGEEFIVLLPETSLDAALSRAEELAGGVRQLTVHHRGRALSGVTASVGVAAWQLNWSPDTLLRAVDAALYLAKANGRDRVERALLEEEPRAGRE